MIVNNSIRANWANEALKKFIDLTFYGKAEGDDRDDAMGDLICDILHLAKLEGKDPDAILRKALSNFEHERQFGPFDQTD